MPSQPTRVPVPIASVANQASTKTAAVRQERSQARSATAVSPPTGEVAEFLTEHLAAFPNAPCLFVGSGLGRRYLGLETWQDLLARFCSAPLEGFPYYRSKANGSLPAAAQLIASDFHSAWFKEGKYAPSLAVWSERVERYSDPLKFEISKYIATKVLPSAGELHAELELLKHANVDVVVTTNWDSLLESVFPDYTVYVGQDQLLWSPTAGIAEIYKIHGSATDPKSLVLTSDDYTDFDLKNPYLTAKLTTLFVEHPVIFIGYSLADENIQKLIHSLALCLGAKGIDRLRDRLIFVEWKQGEAGQVLSGSIQAANSVVPIHRIVIDSFQQVFGALGAVRRKLPARILRRLKEQVYELVSTNDPTGQLHVVNLDEDTEASNIEVVYGVGVSTKLSTKGYSGVKRRDIVEDVLGVGKDRDFDAELILTESAPTLAQGRTLLPVCKYLSETGRVKDGKANTEGLDHRVEELANRTIDSYETSGYESHRKRIEELGSVAAVVDKYTRDRALYLIPLLGRERIVLEELRMFLVRERDYFIGRGSGFESVFNRIVCLYDRCKWGP